MNKKQLIIYIVSILILFAVPIFTIINNTNTLKDGTEYFFKVEAYDPYDMFRGNYLNIQFIERKVLAYADNYSTDNYYNKDCYVTINTRADGFAYFDKISFSKPVNTSNYYKTKCYGSYDKYMYTYTIETPNRYYMNENKSANAEKVYRDNIDNAYVKVRIKNGEMVIVGVYINNVLIDTID